MPLLVRPLATAFAGLLIFFSSHVSCVAEEKKSPPVTSKSSVSQPSVAPSELARQYLQGEGRKADPAKGIAILEAAAKEGDPESQYLLGFHLNEGRHVKQDRARALNLFENGEQARALMNIVLSVGLCVLGCWAGVVLGRQL